MIVDKDVRVVYIYDSDDCGWLCVLKEVLGVQLSTGCGGCGWKDVGMVATQ